MQTNLPVIDLELGTNLIGDKEEAKQLLNFFLQSLPETQATLTRLYQAKNWKQFAYEIEKLLSGACYCSVPRLEEATRELLTVLGQDVTQVNQHYECLISEINELNKLTKHAGKVSRKNNMYKHKM